jgi:uncharacterized protein YndB with AHSA1/START domain
MKTTAGVLIDRPIDHVFMFVSNMEHLPQWARGVVDARRTGGGPQGVGATYQIVGRLLGREIASTYELTAYEPPKTFAAAGAIGPFPLREVYTLAPTTRGTLVHVVSEMEPRGVMTLVAPLCAPLLARLIQTDLSRLKRCLETSA